MKKTLTIAIALIWWILLEYFTFFVDSVPKINLDNNLDINWECYSFLENENIQDNKVYSLIKKQSDCFLLTHNNNISERNKLSSFIKLDNLLIFWNKLNNQDILNLKNLNLKSNILDLSNFNELDNFNKLFIYNTSLKEKYTIKLSNLDIKINSIWWVYIFKDKDINIENTDNNKNINIYNNSSLISLELWENTKLELYPEELIKLDKENILDFNKTEYITNIDFKKENKFLENVFKKIKNNINFKKINYTNNIINSDISSIKRYNKFTFNENKLANNIKNNVIYYLKKEEIINAKRILNNSKISKENKKDIKNIIANYELVNFIDLNNKDLISLNNNLVKNSLNKIILDDKHIKDNNINFSKKRLENIELILDNNLELSNKEKINYDIIKYIKNISLSENNLEHKMKATNLFLIAQDIYIRQNTKDLDIFNIENKDIITNSYKDSKKLLDNLYLNIYDKYLELDINDNIVFKKEYILSNWEIDLDNNTKKLVSDLTLNLDNNISAHRKIYNQIVWVNASRSRVKNNFIKTKVLSDKFRILNSMLFSYSWYLRDVEDNDRKTKSFWLSGKDLKEYLEYFRWVNTSNIEIINNPKLDWYYKAIASIYDYRSRWSERFVFNFSLDPEIENYIYNISLIDNKANTIKLPHAFSIDRKIKEIQEKNRDTDNIDWFALDPHNLFVDAFLIHKKYWTEAFIDKTWQIITIWNEEFR